MATGAITPDRPPAGTRLHRFTMKQYDHMAEIFEDRSIELVNGYVIEKMPKRPLHVLAVEQLRHRLERATTLTLGEKIVRISVKEILPTAK